MRTKHLIFSVVICAAAAVIGAAIGVALAQTGGASANAAASIRYPVAELGNCASQTDCKAYCDVSSHEEACLDFAEKNGLMSQDEISSARKFLAAGGIGPGGCANRDSCETYCNDISHIDECVAFAKKTGILPPDQLKQAEQVQAAIAKGIQPPPCKNKSECDVYCGEPSHMKVCVAFGEAAGFLEGQDLENAKKMVAAIDAGATPPPCNGKDACDAYCSEPDHMEACVTFAQAAGFMTPQEAQNSQKVLEAIKKGVKPPNCNGKDACDKYCAEPEHFDECTNFAVAAGFMSEHDAEIARKTGGKGPGGCTSKESCDAFCQNPDNQETCFNFAKDNGLIPPEDLQKMQEGQKQMRQSLENAPPAVLDCLRNTVGGDVLAKLQSGNFMAPNDIGEKMSRCFPRMGPQGQGQMIPGRPTGPEVSGTPDFGDMPDSGGNTPPGEHAEPQSFEGPGGCKTPQECQKFCGDNPSACQNFKPPQPPADGEMRQDMMPGTQHPYGAGPDVPPYDAEGEGMAPGVQYASGTGTNMPYASPPVPMPGLQYATGTGPNPNMPPNPQQGAIAPMPMEGTPGVAMPGGVYATGTAPSYQQGGMQENGQLQPQPYVAPPPAGSYPPPPSGTAPPPPAGGTQPPPPTSSFLGEPVPLANLLGVFSPILGF